MHGKTLTAVVVLTTSATAFAAAPRPWRPDMTAAERYASHRQGTIAFAVRTRTRSWGWHATTTFPSASVVKAMLLVAYLDMPSVRARRLRASDGALLVPMIRRSDNDAASKVLSIVGSARVYAVARGARMRRFALVNGWWGLSRIDAADQARFFMRIDVLTARRHRTYALRLLKTITPEQRWGIARARPRAALLQGWLGLGHGLGQSSGGAAHARKQARLGRDSDVRQREPRVWAADAPRNRRAPAPRLRLGRRSLVQEETMEQTAGSAYPVQFDVEYPDRELNRLTTGFRIFVAIPILIVAVSIGGHAWGGREQIVVAGSGGVLFLPALLMIVFRQKYPRWWYDWNLELLRFTNRIGIYLALMDDTYPSTDEKQSVTLDFPYPDVERDLNRWLPLVKWLLAIPHFLVLLFLWLAGFVCVVMAWFAILFTGRYPRGLFDFVRGVFRWSNRVTGYAFALVTDEYPPFRLSP